MASAVTVIYCPHEEAVSVARFHLPATAKFSELRAAASRYFAEDLSSVVLKDELGAQWPLGALVVQHLGCSMHLRIRLCQDEQRLGAANIEDTLSPVAQATDEEDDGRVSSARPPLFRELIIHALFILVLLVDTYTTRSTDQEHVLYTTLSKAIVSTRVHNRTFMEISKQSQACDWLKGPFATMVVTDIDASGSMQFYNRLVGGINIVTT